MADLVPFDGRHLPYGAAPPARNGSPRVEDEEDSVDLREFFAVLRRQIWLVVGVAAVVFGVGVLFVFRQVPLYQATATIRIQDERSALAGEIVTGEQELFARSVDPILSEVQVLRSRAVATEVVERAGLRLTSLTPGFSVDSIRDLRIAEASTADTLVLAFANDSFVARVGGQAFEARYGEPVSLPELGFTIPSRPSGLAEVVLVVSPQSRAIEHFRRQLSTSVRDRTNVVDVSYTDPDPARAQRIVNTTIEVFAAMSARSAQAQAVRRREFLSEQLAQTESALARAQLAFTEFQQREGVASSQELLAAQQTALMNLDLRREELVADRQVLGQVLAALEQEDQPTGWVEATILTPGIAENPAVATLFEQLTRLELARDSLTMGDWASASGNPDVQRLDLVIEGTRARLVEALQDYAVILDARIDALDSLRSRNLAEMQSLPASGAEEVRLLQRVQTIGKIADQLREEYQRARILEAVEGGQVEVLDMAALPLRPIGAGRVPTLALALVFGLMLGSGAAFLRERLNTSIHRKEDLEALRIASLAVIPRFIGQDRGRFRLARGTRSVITEGADPNAGTGSPAELVTLADLRSSGSEAYRTLRTNLIFAQAVQSLKTLVVTSSTPSEGKTTTSANLAVVFAQQGVRVLLVDCDLRKGRLNYLFELPREPGLTQLILGFDDASKAIRGTKVPGLFVLPSGTFPPNPSELLGGERMRQCLQELASDFDVVILDTPPLLAAADAAILGRFCDGVLLVVRAGQTDRAAAQQAIEQLRAVGANVVGAALNDRDAKMEAYGEFYRYEYYGAEASS